MHFTAATVVAIATAVLASENIAIPLRKVHNVGSVKNLVDRGNAKLRHINSKAVSARASSPVTNDVVSYVASVTVGANSYSLIVDTGSSNTWVGAQSAYAPGPNSKDTGNSVSVSYGSGSFSGEEYTDAVTFAGLTVKAQSIGAASNSQGFDGVDGIFGVGPVDLTQNTVSNTASVPTFLDNLYKQGSISSEVLGVSFRPESGSDTSDTNGELTLGGTDSSKYKGSISYFPSPGPYWGVSVSSFTYGTKSLGSGSGIVDTGTTLIYIPTSAYNAFLSAAGGKTDSSSGLAVFSKAPTSNFSLKVNGVTYTLTPAQYLVPQAEYSLFGLTSGKYYAWINNGGSSGVNTIIGQKFLENYYSVYDTNNARVGFAANA